MQNIVLATCLIFLAACSTGGPVASKQDVSGEAPLRFDAGDLDPAVRPQDDFFLHTNGRWIANNEIPPEQSRYGTIQIVHERTQDQLRKIIERIPVEQATVETDPRDRQIADLYASFMDIDRIETLGLSPIQRQRQKIDAIENYDDLIEYFGSALRIGITVPIDFYVDANASSPDTTLAYFWQSGLGMPDRDYYLEESDELIAVRQEYQAHISRMLQLAGHADPETAAQNIMAIENRIAQNHWSKVRNRDRQKIYSNQFSLAEANDLSVNFDWPRFLSAAEFGQPEKFVIAQTDYFVAVGGLIRSIGIDAWKDYLLFHTLRSFAPFLNEQVVIEDFSFRRKTLRGQESIRPRWKRGVALVDRSLGESLGRLYVAEHFPPAAKQRMDQMIEDLRQAFSESIDSLEWMSPETKLAAQDKLGKFTAKIGYPESFKDYSTIVIDKTDLAGNVERAREFDHRYAVAKLSKPVDRDDWGMTPQTINAYYRPTFNQIVFPAGILQPPFFDSTADDALNYGAIGAVIGHEFSHGFDDQGRKFSGDGELTDWWTQDDARQYTERSQTLVNQYNAFRPLVDQAVNGKLTLGENIADLAGVIMAYRAWKIRVGDSDPEPVDGLTAQQRFFLGFATTWRTRVRDDYLRQMLINGPHSPPRYRVNGTLRNVAEFYDAFDMQPGDGMYVPPEERASIW